MRRVKTERFIEQIFTNGSVPCLFECSDGETYYVKHYGNNRLHVINELIGSVLLQLLELPTPDIALVEVVPGSIEGQNFERKAPCGVAFGSRQLPGHSKSLDRGDLFEGPEIRKFTAHQSLVGIVLFDIWVYNTDRTQLNPNVLVEQIAHNRFRFVAIDHAMIFDGKDYRDLGSSGEILSPTIEDSLIAHPLYRQVYDSFGLFISEEADRVLDRIESLSEDELHYVLQVIPDEWEVKDAEKDAIIKHYLLPRKDLVRGFYQQLLVDAKIQIL